MELTLDIYVAPNCDACIVAQRTAVLVQNRLPEVEVRILDLSHPSIKRPASVFAVPTYLLNGETVSLGNPKFEDLLARLENHLKAS